MSATNSNAICLTLSAMPIVSRLLDGGFEAGKLYGVVGPSGGGKTLLATQITLAVASTEKTVVYAGLEKSNDYTGRIKRLLSGARAGAEDSLVDELRSISRKSLRGHLRLLHGEAVSNWTAQSLAAYVAHNRDSIDLVVIDQLQHLLDGPVMNHRTVKGVCRELRHIARVYDVPIILLHQARVGMSKEEPVHIPTTRDVMESRDFVSDHVDGCLIIGRYDDNKICWITNPGSDRRELVWLDGDNNRFRSVGRPGDFIDVDRDLKKFVLSAEAELLGLQTVADVAGYLQAGFALGQEPAVSRELPNVKGVN